MENRFIKFLYSSVLLFVVWSLLNGNLHTETVLIGVFVSLLVAYLFRKTFVLKVHGLKNLYYFVVYFFVLAYEITKANFQVAKIVLSPKINVDSRVIANKTVLKSKMARLILASSITLTPGTLTVDVDGETFYIHYMNYKDGDDAVKVFEKYLEKIYA